jgi:DNA-binding GntR family transcriptional regulator
MDSQPSPGAAAPRPLRRAAGTSLHRQVVDDLRSRISDGQLRAGHRLEPEAELAARYGVNRLTVRRALEELARIGVVRTEHGVGSFVAAPPVRHRIDDGAASLAESMARRGIAVRHRVLDVTEADQDGDERFPDFDGRAVQFRFVRYLEDEPWSIGEILVPASIAPLDWNGQSSVFAVIGARHQLTIKRSERVFSATPASPEDAGWLDAPAGSPLLDLRGFNTDQHGRVIAAVAHRIRGDRAEYVVRL